MKYSKSKKEVKIVRLKKERTRKIKLVCDTDGKKEKKNWVKEWRRRRREWENEGEVEEEEETK